MTACLIACSLMAEAKDWTQYVNPLMGTQSSFELSTGNTYPAIARPWGMNFWTPQTGKMGDGWQYTYTANKIRGFKQTHQPSPWINDYGQFSIMPVTGKLEFDEEKRASWFSHKGEIAVKPQKRLPLFKQEALLRVRQLSIYSQNHTDNVYNHRTSAHRNAAGLPLTETGLKEDSSNHHPAYLAATVYPRY